MPVFQSSRIANMPMPTSPAYFAQPGLPPSQCGSPYLSKRPHSGEDSSKTRRRSSRAPIPLSGSAPYPTESATSVTYANPPPIHYAPYPTAPSPVSHGLVLRPAASSSHQMIDGCAAQHMYGYPCYGGQPMDVDRRSSPALSSGSDSGDEEPLEMSDCMGRRLHGGGGVEKYASQYPYSPPHGTWDTRAARYPAEWNGMMLQTL